MESPCPLVNEGLGQGWEGERESVSSADLRRTHRAVQPWGFCGASKPAAGVTLSWAWALVSELPAPRPDCPQDRLLHLGCVRSAYRGLVTACCPG